nr:conjugative relaxase [Phenylobacterium sp.]
EGESQVWQGRGAEMLGLSGQAQAGRFQDLLAGRVTPGQTAARGSTRADSKSRIGIDFTFSAPKSVSILALVGGHSVLVEAHDRAVTKVMELVEQQARARQKSAGVTHEERTGNLIIAKFRHETTREQDPALHTHAVIMNLTRRADGQWRALSNEAIIKMTG